MVFTRRWQESELDTLRQRYGAIPVGEIAEMIGRSPRAVYDCARKLRLRACEDGRRKIHAATATASGWPASLSLREVQVLCLLMANGSPMTMPEILRRLQTSAIGKSYVGNLKKLGLITRIPPARGVTPRRSTYALTGAAYMLHGECMARREKE